MDLRRIPRAAARRIAAKARAIVGGPAPYLFLPAPSIESQLIRFRFAGTTFTVEAGHSTPLYETIAEVVDYDCYQLDRLDRATLATGSIVDVGGNVGITALCFSRLASRVFCFEPLSENAARLRANVARNGATNVTVFESAITRSNGRATFWVPAHEDVGGRTGEPPAGAGGRILEVASLDLATALAPVPDPIVLMKVDCEGGEYDLVGQLTPDIARRVPTLTFEVHERPPERSVRTLSAQLESLGYTLSFRPDPFGRPQLTHVLARR